MEAVPALAAPASASPLTRQSQATDGVQTVDRRDAGGPLAGRFGAGFTDVAESFALRAVEVDQDIDILTLWLRLDVRYRLTERTTLYGNAIYWDQSRGGDSAFGRDYDRFRVNLGVEYQFDPIRL